MNNLKTECAIGQGFSGNATSTYAASGLRGHPGVDNDCGYGSPIHAYFDNEYVYKVLTTQSPSNDGSGFTGVFTIVDNGIECFEFLYGHCDPTVPVGYILARGDVLGTQSNHGEVYDGGMRITLAMQQAGDHRGSHRHDQKRVLRKDRTIQPNTQYLTDKDGILCYNDYYYAIPYFKNGFNGCINWLLPIFNRTLCVGMSGYDVTVLQNILKKGGYFTANTTDFFGPVTMKAVMAFQKAHGLSPVGLVGPQTRQLLNNLTH